MVLKTGQAVIAPGGRHLTVDRTHSGDVRIRLDDGPKIGGHKPSVDRLFASAADVFGRKAIGVILTGMGRDGARGLFQMREAGAATVGQDEATSVIFGMPRAAQEVGAVDYVEPLNRIPERLRQLMQQLHAPEQEGEPGHAR